MDFINFKRIPEISDEELAFLAANIQPLISRNDSLYLIASPLKDYRTTTFLRDAKPGMKANRFQSIGTIITFHTFGAPSLFKPSIAEVMAQIKQQVPSEWLPRVRGFHIESENLGSENVLTDGYHFAKTYLYERVICKGGKDSGTVIGRELHDGKTEIY